MANIVPGFIWHPIDVGNRAKRVKGRGAVGHVAVSGSVNLVPSGTPATRSADWHWYNPKVGPGIQYIDLDLQCWASGSGNRTLPAFESQGGLGTAAQVNAEPWNDNQIENAARFYAHLVETEGAPLQVMPNSLPGSRGLAGHRHGIDPWRCAGGESWSSSRGKLCPGDAKMAQLPVIVARASEIVHGSPTPTPTPQPVTVLEEDMPVVLRDPDHTMWIYTGLEMSRMSDVNLSTAQQKINAGRIIDITWPEVDALSADVDRRRGLLNAAVWATPIDDKGNVVNGSPWASTRLAGIDAKTGTQAAK
jgi:hypothetical protein